MTYEVSQEHTVVKVPVVEIFSDSEFNCRKTEITPFSVQELAKDIESTGLQQPIIIQPHAGNIPFKYRIIIGHRRFEAVRVLRWETIPAIIRSDLSDTEARILNLSENVQREQLNVLEEAKAIMHLYSAGYTQDDVSQLLSKSRGWVQVRYTLLKLPEDIQQEAAAGFLTQSDIKDLYGMSLEKMHETVKLIKTARLNGGNLTVKKLREREKRKQVKRNERRTRNVLEIFNMQTTIRNVIGNCLATRGLAWAAGEISDLEFLESLKDNADKIGIPWSIPVEYYEK